MADTFFHFLHHSTGKRESRCCRFLSLSYPMEYEKVIHRIAQPQPEGLRSSGLGAAPQQAENHSFCGSGMDGFFAFVLQMHCWPLLLTYEISPEDLCVWNHCIPETQFF